MEFLLANHPLDCPICDQGGECDLQVTADVILMVTFKGATFLRAVNKQKNRVLDARNRS